MESQCVSVPGGIVEVVLNGRLDRAGSEALEADLGEQLMQSPNKIVVNLSGVSFLASVGTRLLLMWTRRQSALGGALVLAAPQRMVLKVLEAAGIDALIAIAPDLDSARAKLSAVR